MFLVDRVTLLLGLLGSNMTSLDVVLGEVERREVELGEMGLSEADLGKVGLDEMEPLPRPLFPENSLCHDQTDGTDTFRTSSLSAKSKAVD
ncbi:hypothetical protein BGX23_000646 [Mortierella sp. AD031]|nr:hypothetical protein BGX23_000646 [Mortierella sp. AD031]